MDSTKTFTGCLTLLSRLLLGADENKENKDEISSIVAAHGLQELGELWSLSTSHHVIMRTFPRLYEAMVSAGNERAAWVQDAIAKEGERIDHALSFLGPICEALQEAGDVLVIKSLDHW